MAISKNIRYFLCLFILQTSLLSAQAADQLKAVTEYLPPLNYEKNGKVLGFSSELLDLIALEAKIQIKKEILPWPRAYKRAKEEDNTVIYSLVRTPERESQFQWLGPISPRSIMLYRLSQRTDIVIKKLDDARAYNIGVVRESAASENLIRLGFDTNKLDLALDDEINMRKFKYARFDLLLSLDWAANFNAEKLGIQNDIVPVQLVMRQPDYWFGISLRTDPAIVQRMNRALHKIKRDGRLNTLKQRYLAEFKNERHS
ncbi:substrate-binding periplasmic protein [Janthinobacterium sp. B9-8]|uniref:substrate-binding periplasmic protein n=1 Tax=Janthinobacterium sp. B9-8 TaxID=1236179 RepID=UPI00069C3ADB|nr:transporter substrate-binding domain-containing protein [Janthinobacterium sp. B9-8]AMC33493.1 hypothetical protein VN23_02190 [Janthinobacterium sp. B9-8]